MAIKHQLHGVFAVDHLGGYANDNILPLAGRNMELPHAPRIANVKRVLAVRIDILGIPLKDKPGATARKHDPSIFGEFRVQVCC